LGGCLYNYPVRPEWTGYHSAAVESYNFGYNHFNFLLIFSTFNFWKISFNSIKICAMILLF